jgi:hypothetical protein
MSGVEADFAQTSEAWQAANAFFMRQVHPQTMAIAKVYTAPVPAAIVSQGVDLTNLKTVTAGGFTIGVGAQANTDPVLYTVSPIDFSTITDLNSVITVLNTAFTAASAPIIAQAYTPSLQAAPQLQLVTTSSGDNVTMTWPESITGVTDVTTYLGLTSAAGGIIYDGYTPTGIAGEAQLVYTAARCMGNPIYGWCLERSYRETDEQKNFADWIESKVPAYFSACTNSSTAYNTADTTNIGYYCMNKGYTRTSVIYHDNAQVYPDVSYAALALATNYGLPDSALTMKFKMLDGIEPSPLTESMLAALDSRRINSYVAIGNNARTTREGVQSAATWFTDTLINLDNFREELQVEVYNVFLRNPKVPYTTAGQDKLVSAAAKICRRYVRNGVFAMRDVEDGTTETGFTTYPPFSIVPVNVAFSTMSERAARLAPPINIIAYEAGAFHKVSVNVDVYN